MVTNSPPTATLSTRGRRHPITTATARIASPQATGDQIPDSRGTQPGTRDLVPLTNTLGVTGRPATASTMVAAGTTLARTTRMRSAIRLGAWAPALLPMDGGRAGPTPTPSHGK